MTNPRPRVAVVQDGARLHYLLPLAMHRAGLLERVLLSSMHRPDHPRPRAAISLPDSGRDWHGEWLCDTGPELPIDRIVAQSRGYCYPNSAHASAPLMQKYIFEGVLIWLAAGFVASV